MAEFSDSRRLVNELATKTEEAARGKSLAESGTDVKWVRLYGFIARRCRDDKEFGVTPCPHERGHGLAVFAGGFVKHREWPLRKKMKSTRAYGRSLNMKRTISTPRDTG